MSYTHFTSEVLGGQQPGLPDLKLLTAPVRLQHQALVVPQVLQHELGHVGVARVLPHQNLPVALHGAAVTEENVQGPADPLRQAGVADRRHAKAYVEVPPPQGHVGQLLLRAAAKNDVVHEDADVPVAPLLLHGFLLNQQFVYQVLVPLRKKEPGVPEPLHHGLNGRVAGRAPDKTHHKLKLRGHLEQQVTDRRALAGPPGPHASYYEGHHRMQRFGVPSWKH